MTGVPVIYGVGSDARAPADERERITAWRAEQLFHAGASYELTKVLAKRHDIELHTLLKWYRGGATEEQIRATFL
jgi:hypothetical protein